MKRFKDWFGSRFLNHSAPSYILWISFGLSVLILLLRCGYLYSPDALFDDAYISFRYSSNLAHGLGLVFNPGERVEGYTNFLWTALLAGCAALRLDIVWCSILLAFGAATGTLLVLGLFSQRLWKGRRLEAVLASLPLILFALMPSQARYVVSGMETLLFVFLVTLSSYLFYQQRWLLAGLSFSLAALTRPEGLMYFLAALGYAGIFFSANLVKQKKLLSFLLQFLGSFLLIYGIYFIWRWNYYGYLLPNTFYVKASGISIALILRGWNYMVQVLRDWSLLPLLLVGFFAMPSIRSNRIWLLWIGFAGLTLLYFLAIGGDFVGWFGPRFFMPVLPLILILAVEGFSHIDSLPIFQRIHPLPALLVIIVLLFNSLWFSWPAKFDWLIGFEYQMHSWKELGIWMKSNLPADTRIATDAAGLIPYYSNLYSIDMFGLTDLHIAHLRVANLGTGIVAHEKFDPFYILNQKPGCIISTWMDEEGNATSAALPAVNRQMNSSYRLVAVAKVRNGAPQDGRWVIPTVSYSQGLYLNGYQTGLYCLAQPNQ